MQSLTAGQVLAGRFRLVRPLGEGGIGEVWLAERVSDTGQVALKFPRSNGTDIPAGARLLRAEFGQAGRLVHPGIVRMYEFCEGPPACTVMQYVAGPDLGALRGAGFRTVLQALVPVAESLEYAHRQGIVHRDLKPSNVLRDGAGAYLLTDFGLGAFSAGGTPPGMSPQQLVGDPPAVSDDVYGFGALLYELLAGQPLFHPDVTPERIRDETPEAPAADLAGERLPPRLRQLLAALLQKPADRRPPGMGAVRDALEQILRDNTAAPSAGGAGVIVPLERSRPAGGQSAPGAPAPARLPRAGPRANRVYAALAALLVVALVVVLYLPTAVRLHGPLVSAIPTPDGRPPAAAPAAATVPAAPPVPQAVLDETLGEFLRNDDALHKAGADKWGGADWAEMRRLAQAGDDAYRTRDSGAALASYRKAADLARQLLARAPKVLADAVHSAETALTAGNQAAAIAGFETALAIAPDHAQAARGLERARKLDQVLALATQASAAESAGRRDEALQLFRQAAALDPAWGPAVAGVSRLQQVASREAYETQMARGFAAQAAKNPDGAHAAFADALRSRPGDSAAAAALAQVESDQHLAKLATLQAEAHSLEQQERWADAAVKFEAALASDGNLLDARQGAVRARGRAELDGRMRRELANSDRFNDDAVLARAHALLDSARAVENPGPVLTGQVAELARLLDLAAVPVTVTLESDNMTEVTVFKVGRLGAFANRTLALRPGAYVAVGSRPGYRDVRRAFRVEAGNAMSTVVVRCEDPI